MGGGFFAHPAPLWGAPPTYHPLEAIAEALLVLCRLLTASLPTSVEADRIHAELKNGILTITLPKKEEAKPKQITVNIKEEGR